MENLPVIDLESFLKDSTSAKSDCELIAKCFSEMGIVIIRDPRVTYEHNNTFLDLMEKYYGLPHDVKIKDARPQYHYQVGCTPEGIERPRDNSRFVKSVIQSDSDMPVPPSGADPKWRYFWRIGQRPQNTSFPELNVEQVVPETFKGEWETVMNMWGTLMLQAVTSVAEMLAVGLGLSKDEFSRRMKNGPHLLAPTGSDLGRFSNLNQIFAGFHYDLNFLTIHGKSRFPGLEIWLRSGKKVPVKVPDGCLLVQAGKQVEYLTTGKVLAGFHQVIVTPDTLKAVENARAAGRSLWRVSSTLFSHIASDETLEPIGSFKSLPEASQYPSVKTGDQVQNELKAIALAAGANGEDATVFYG